MVNIEAQLYNAMKNINYLTKLFFHCLAKLIQQMYHFKGLLVGFVGDFFNHTNPYFGD